MQNIKLRSREMRPIPSRGRDTFGGISVIPQGFNTASILDLKGEHKKREL